MYRAFWPLIFSLLVWQCLPSIGVTQQSCKADSEGRQVAHISRESISIVRGKENKRQGITGKEQYYEIRSYLLPERADSLVIDEYLGKALLPALNRQGVGPIGVFSNSTIDQSGSNRIVVVIPYDDLGEIASVKSAVEMDAEYQVAGKTYLETGPESLFYQRIESELLISMACMPSIEVPEGTLKNRDRVYELRVYESPNERLGNLKVEMFNSGEVPIFLACGIQPIFIGQSLVGPHTPNLTYLTMYPDDEAREKSWVTFRDHPDWQLLKEIDKYKGSVSKIHKFILVPKVYSQM